VHHPQLPHDQLAVQLSSHALAAVTVGSILLSPSVVCLPGCVQLILTGAAAASIATPACEGSRPAGAPAGAAAEEAQGQPQAAAAEEEQQLLLLEALLQAVQGLPGAAAVTLAQAGGLVLSAARGAGAEGGSAAAGALAEAASRHALPASQEITCTAEPACLALQPEDPAAQSQHAQQQPSGRLLLALHLASCGEPHLQLGSTAPAAGLRCVLQRGGSVLLDRVLAVEAALESGNSGGGEMRIVR
jgi:hypothetical protein